MITKTRDKTTSAHPLWEPQTQINILTLISKFDSNTNQESWPTGLSCPPPPRPPHSLNSNDHLQEISVNGWLVIARWQKRISFGTYSELIKCSRPV